LGKKKFLDKPKDMVCIYWVALRLSWMIGEYQDTGRRSGILSVVEKYKVSYIVSGRCT
jgi:hypothetical protein